MPSGSGHSTGYIYFYAHRGSIASRVLEHYPQSYPHRKQYEIADKEEKETDRDLVDGQVAQPVAYAQQHVTPRERHESGVDVISNHDREAHGIEYG